MLFADRGERDGGVGSGSAATGEHDWNRLGENLDVEHRRPIVDVFEIELDPLIEIDLIAAMDLPEASQAGTHGESSALPAFIG